MAQIIKGIITAPCSEDSPGVVETEDRQEVLSEASRQREVHIKRKSNGPEPVFKRRLCRSLQLGEKVCLRINSHDPLVVASIGPIPYRLQRPPVAVIASKRSNPPRMVRHRYLFRRVG